MKLGVYLIVLVVILVNASPVRARTCKEEGARKLDFEFNEVKLEACAGQSGVKWGITNLTSDKLEVKFNKVYRFSCGKTEVIKADIFLKPGEFINGGFFSGDLDLGDPLWPKEACGKGGYLKGVQIQNYKVINESAKERKRQEEKEKKEREKAEKERLKLEREERERERLELQHRQEETARKKAESERAEKRRVEKIREKHAEERSENLRERAREKRRFAENTQQYHDSTTRSFSDFASGAMDNNAVFNGLTWYCNIGLGLQMLSFPLYQDSQTETGFDYYGNPIYSTSTEASDSFGLGAKTNIEFWPLFGEHFGIGGFGSYSYGVAANESVSSTVVELGYGIRGFAGTESIAGLFEFSKLSRVGDWSFDAASYGVNTKSSGSATADITRTGLGVRFGNLLEKSGSGGAAFDLMLLTDEISNIYRQSTFWSTPETVKAYVYRARMNMGPMVFEGEYGPDYPVAGTPTRTPFGSSDKGTYWSILFMFSYRIFGEPYL